MSVIARDIRTGELVGEVITTVRDERGKRAKHYLLVLTRNGYEHIRPSSVRTEKA